MTRTPTFFLKVAKPAGIHPGTMRDRGKSTTEREPMKTTPCSSEPSLLETLGIHGFDGLDAVTGDI